MHFVFGVFIKLYTVDQFLIFFILFLKAWVIFNCSNLLCTVLIFISWFYNLLFLHLFKLFYFDTIIFRVLQVFFHLKTILFKFLVLFWKALRLTLLFPENACKILLFLSWAFFAFLNCISVSELKPLYNLLSTFLWHFCRSVSNRFDCSLFYYSSSY